jgi:hypothetical protein
VDTIAEGGLEDFRMNVEIYSYSLFTTVLGMLVVFLSLTALSVMMVMLKAVFAGRQKPGANGGARRRRERKAKPGAESKTAKGGEQLPIWVSAALAVFWAEEQDPNRPSADPWNAVVNQHDPWMVGGRSSKRGV